MAGATVSTAGAPLRSIPTRPDGKRLHAKREAAFRHTYAIQSNGSMDARLLATLIDRALTGLRLVRDGENAATR